MKLKFIKVDATAHKAKATIHQTGKLGFSSDAANYLGLSESSFIQFAVNEDDPNDENIYGVVSGNTEEGSYKVSKAGSYYYLNTKGLFDSLNIDYKDKRVIYDITKMNLDGQEIIKFMKREIKKKQKEDNDK